VGPSSATAATTTATGRWPITLYGRYFPEGAEPVAVDFGPGVTVDAVTVPAPTMVTIDITVAVCEGLACLEVVGPRTVAIQFGHCPAVELSFDVFGWWGC